MQGFHLLNIYDLCVWSLSLVSLGRKSHFSHDFISPIEGLGKGWFDSAILETQKATKPGCVCVETFCC